VSLGGQGVRAITIALPTWVDDVVEWDRRYDEADRMDLAIALSRVNVERGTGGPFGAAVFESDSGVLIGVGVNCVETFNNAILHGEVVAIMFAQRRIGSFTLGGPAAPARELVSSCEPCAMCLGATLWSGVRRLTYAASRADAAAVGFDEGPVFPESYTYLERRGIRIDRDLRREEAAAVLRQYRDAGGLIYGSP
jgi:tRNA(Arg) A34 adenosine deaminase TadA